MKSLLIIITTSISLSVNAQIDMSRDPNKPVIPPKKSNAQLLKESQQPTQNMTDSNLSDKYKANGIVTSPNGNQYNENGKMGQQSQQYNLGNGGTKATNTINYDNSGKVQGSSTTIEFGKKKKK